MATKLWVGARVRLIEEFDGHPVVPAGSTGTVVHIRPGGSWVRVKMDTEEFNWLGRPDGSEPRYHADNPSCWELVPDGPVKAPESDAEATESVPEGTPTDEEKTYTLADWIAEGNQDRINGLLERPEGVYSFTGQLHLGEPGYNDTGESEEVHAPWTAATTTQFDMDVTPEGMRFFRELMGKGVEERVVDPDTGGAKGRKDAEYALIPTNPLEEVAKVYGFGAKKYSVRNWEKSYAWSLSYSALQRHVNAFWGGEDMDPESGLSHLAHATFHCFAMMEWMRTHPETDDRPETGADSD